MFRCLTVKFVRPYSMANLPGEQLLEFHIQLMPQGRVSSYIAGQLKVGDKVKAGETVLAEAGTPDPDAGT